jgi:hypothetical protein
LSGCRARLYSVPSKDVRLTDEHSNRPLHILPIGLLFLVCSPSAGQEKPTGCTDLHLNVHKNCASRSAFVSVHSMEACMGAGGGGAGPFIHNPSAT